MASENPRWGDQRIREELLRLGMRVSATAIRTKPECLDWLLVLGRGHLEQVLRIYIQHFNQQRPYRALGLEPPGPSAGRTLVGEA